MTRGLRDAGWRSAAIALALAGTAGCTTIELDFGQLPPTRALASVEPGVTTRAEVLRRLGPPEEYRRPGLLDQIRITSPQRRRVLEEHQIFARDAYTYASGHHTIRSFGILPAGITLFSISQVRSAEHRWRIEFDEADVVSSVSSVDERR